MSLDSELAEILKEVAGVTAVRAAAAVRLPQKVPATVTSVANGSTAGSVVQVLEAGASASIGVVTTVTVRVGQGVYVDHWESGAAFVSAVLG